MSLNGLVQQWERRWSEAKLVRRTASAEAVLRFCEGQVESTLSANFRRRPRRHE